MAVDERIRTLNMCIVQRFEQWFGQLGCLFIVCVQCDTSLDDEHDRCNGTQKDEEHDDAAFRKKIDGIGNDF